MYVVFITAPVPAIHIKASSMGASVGAVASGKWPITDTQEDPKALLKLFHIAQAIRFFI